MKRLSRQILEQMLAESSEEIVVAEASGPDFPVVFANRAYAELSECEITALRGCRLPLLDDERLDSADRDKLETALVEGHAFEVSLDPDPDGGPESSTLVRMILWCPIQLIRALLMRSPVSSWECCSERSTVPGKSLRPWIVLILRPAFYATSSFVNWLREIFASPAVKAGGWW
jgi:hypothetical protein